MEEYETKFVELYNEYYEEIYRYAVSYTSDADKAAEVTHEAFVRLWMKWDLLCNNHSVQNKIWLIKAISNIAKENYRETQRSGAQDISEMADFLAGENNIERKNEDLQYEYYLNKIKDELKPKEREVFEMMVQGIPYAEMSQKLGAKEVTIRSTISRMRARLKEKVVKMMAK